MENINIEEIIYKWFEMKYQTYDKLEHDGSIYLYDEGQKYADIRIDKNDEFIYYKSKLYNEFFEIIPLEYIEFDGFMSKWVGDTFGLKGFTPDDNVWQIYKWLEIPKINN